MGTCGPKQNLGGIKPIAPGNASSSRDIEVYYCNEVLFWLRLEFFSHAISIALAYVIIGVCHTMKRERNGNH